jgi:2-succinyl-5-enolpyruvyl-6-hydroxy-3-cyclohexene-1-carboxylate synthase
LSAGPGLIVCGRGTFTPGFKQAVTRLARQLGCPLLADPLSGLRYGAHERSHVLARYDSFLRNAHFIQSHPPAWVLRFGALPISKPLQNYLGGAKTARQLVVTPFTPWHDPDHVADRIIRSDPEALCQALLSSGLEPGDPRWHAGFLAEEQRVAKLEADHELPLEGQVLHALEQCCAADTSFFAGNSLVIRDVDSFLSGGRQPLTITGNRGASGIDGNVSTTLGIAAAGAARVVGLLGDLALYHDMNGLFAARSLKTTLIVFNNGGGGIFEYLAQAKLPQFERYWLTPPLLDIGQIARLYDLGYHRVSNAGDFRQAFRQTLDSNRTDLIEVSVDRQQSVARHRAYWEAVINRS